MAAAGCSGPHTPWRVLYAVLAFLITGEGDPPSRHHLPGLISGYFGGKKSSVTGIYNHLTSINCKIMCHNNGHVPITPELLDTLPAKLSWGFLTPWWRGVPFWLAYDCNFLKFCHPFGQHCWLPVIHLQGTTILVYAQYKLWPWLSPHQPILCGAQQLRGCVASCCATPSSACHASWLSHCLLSFSHCAALLLSCRTSSCCCIASCCPLGVSPSCPLFMLAYCCINSPCPLVVPHLLHCLLISTCRPLVILLYHHVALLLSCCASWLLHYLFSSSCCATLSSSHCAGWLFRCLSLCRPLVLLLCQWSSPCHCLAIVHHRCHQTPSNAAITIERHHCHHWMPFVHCCHICRPLSLSTVPTPTFIHHCHQRLMPVVATSHRWCQLPSLPHHWLSVV